jgi:hypothetical protein
VTAMPCGCRAAFHASREDDGTAALRSSPAVAATHQRVLLGVDGYQESQRGGELAWVYGWGEDGVKRWRG